MPHEKYVVMDKEVLQGMDTRRKIFFLVARSPSLRVLVDKLMVLHHFWRASGQGMSITTPESDGQHSGKPR
ncbi:hypothetical protein KCP70_14860 [Salmonella enterica subsp. enterica]|nr:hypothetical protein KCP70_14860 [Salmonella enterica subsp. enterica]